MILGKRVKNMREKIYNIIDVDGNEDILSVLYDRVMIFCILGSVIPLCFKGNSVVFIWIEKVTVWLFIIDYILRWITADFRHSERKKMAFIEYPFTFYGIVDLLSILPSLVVLNSSFKLFRLLRLNKAFKALRLLRYSKSFNMILSVVQRERQALITVCVLAGGYIFLVALIMFQVEPESFNSFFDAIYLSVVTLTYWINISISYCRIWRYLSNKSNGQGYKYDFLFYGYSYSCITNWYYYGGLYE